MKTKRTAKFHKKLTLKQVAHCKENNITPNNIVNGLIYQRKQDLTKNLSIMWCRECGEIASRLGLADELENALDELNKELV